MNFEKQTSKALNPEERANIISKVFFFYTRNIFQKGFKNKLQTDDIYEIRPSFRSETLGDMLEKAWNELKIEKRFSLVLVLWKCFWVHFVILSCSQIVPIVATMFRPRLIKKFLSYYRPGSALTKNETYFYGLSLVLLIFVDFVYRTNYFLRAESFGIKIRAAICSLVYRKVLKMDSYQLGKISLGKILSLVSRDVYDLEVYVAVLITALTGIIQSFVICGVLYVEVGTLMYIIFGAFCALITIQAYFGVIITSLKLKASKKCDERYQATKEILSSLKFIKSLIWEKYFVTRASNMRRKEINLFRKMSNLLYVQTALAEMILNILWYILIISSIFFNASASTETFFLIMNTLHSLDLILKVSISRLMHDSGQAVAALKRIENAIKSIDEESYERKVYDNLPPKSTLTDVHIYVQNRKILQNVNLSFKKTFKAITGPIGTGKSLLLKIILQEHKEFKGNLNVGGSISYASQEPWLFPSTIKQNILFGNEYNEERYREVVRVCCLIKDFQSFKDGDSTIVADRGANLSKGQQVRINLARSVYRDSDIYLLDDPLCSLDILVANLILENCILKFFENKFVVMVTQNQKHITRAKNVFILKDETVELLRHSISDQLIKPYELEIKNWNDEEKEDNSNDIDEERKLLIKNSTKNIYEEYKKSGQVEYSVYKNYLRSGGIRLLLLVFLLFFIAQLSKSIKDKLETKWLSAEQIISSCVDINCTLTKHNSEAIKERTLMLYLYPILILIIGILTNLKSFTQFTFGIRASRNLHEQTLTTIVNTPIKYLDNSFVGNILNRFSKDLIIVDEAIPVTCYKIYDSVLELFALTIVITTVNIFFLIPSAALIFLLFLLRVYYLRTGRSLQRIDISTRSPLIGHLHATLEGLATIRTAQAENILRVEFDRHLDIHISASYMKLCCLRAFTLATQIFSTVFIAMVVIRFLIASDGFSVGQVGLALSQALILTGYISLGIGKWAEIENFMTSVERIFEYSQLPQEFKQGIVVESWPMHGEIKYQNVCLSHKNSKRYVLNNINFVIKPKQKVAVIGRTAAGKTSLINTLLRFYQIEGKILIDNVDIQIISLDFYRSNISVIFQDPVLFTGTIRDNIDPTGKYSDDEIWKAIQTIQMEKCFPNLNFFIENGGSNFSLGQKQLVCLGRAILKKNKIVLLDEITANVDPRTEDLIHKIIRKHFDEATVFIITHKLNFALYCDKVLVLNEGTIVEYANPTDVLQNTVS